MGNKQLGPHKYPDGCYWTKNNLLHREDGPAIKLNNGTNMWYQNGKRHRLDGPAIEFYYGNKEYYLNGKYYPDIKTDEEWIIFQIIN